MKVNFTPTVILQLADDYHQLFLQTLIQSYNDLAAIYFRYRRHCVSGLQRGTLKDSLRIPALILTGDITAMSQESNEPGGADGADVDFEGKVEGASEDTRHHRSSTSIARSSSTSPSHRPSSASVHVSRSRRSSHDNIKYTQERNLSDEQDARDISTLYSLPPLHTLSYRMRSSGSCCAWEDPDLAGRLILADLQQVSQQLFTLWNAFQHLKPHIIGQVIAYERKRWEQRERKKWIQFVFKEKYQIEDRWRVGHTNM